MGSKKESGAVDVPPGPPGGAAPDQGADRRRSRRREDYGAFVAIEAPAVSEELCWSGTLMDVNGDGMALTLPPEIRPGAEVLLSLRLDENTHLNRVPGVVVRRDGGVGAIEFGEWSEEDRLKLLSFLLDR